MNREFILVGGKHIADIECCDQFFIHELSIDAEIQSAKRAELIKLLLTFQPEKTVQRDHGSLIDL